MKTSFTAAAALILLTTASYAVAQNPPAMPNVTLPRQQEDPFVAIQKAVAPQAGAAAENAAAAAAAVAALTPYDPIFEPVGSITTPVSLDYINRLGGLDLLVTAPDDDKPHPLLVWADTPQGGASELLTHLAQHGYIVVQPAQRDTGKSEEHPLRIGGFSEMDPREMTYIIENIDKLVAAVPKLRSRIDTTKIAGGGDTFGTDTRQKLAATQMKPLNDEKAPSSQYPNFKGFVIMAPEDSGKGAPLIPASSIGAPVLYVTGKPPKNGDAPLPAGATYALYLAGADGGVPPAANPQDPTAPSIEVLNNAVLAYLDALVLQDEIAVHYMTTNALWTQSRGRIYLGFANTFTPVVPAVPQTPPVAAAPAMPATTATPTATPAVTTP